MADVEVHFVVPGNINTLTGGYIYDKRIIAGLPQEGIEVKPHFLDNGFPFPSASARARAASVVKNIPDGAILIIDGPALAPLWELWESEHLRLHLVALIHHPLSQETGLKQQQVRTLALSERLALCFCERVIVTSVATRICLANEYNVENEIIRVVEPGVDLTRQAKRRTGRQLHLICVGSVVPRKGHKILIKALSLIRKQSWSLTCVGDLERDPISAAEAINCVQRNGLGGRIKFTGELDAAALRVEYGRADVFVLASFHEGYGMALAEALAHGLPIVSTRAGAIAHTVPRSAGLLVEPGNALALSAAITRVLDEPRCRRSLIAGSRGSKKKKGTWRSVISSFGSELKEFASGE